MNLTETLQFIHSTDWKGSQPGLERMEELLHHLDDPQKKLKFVHVAGTNGKGSVCAMLASVLTASGFRTGLYTSPHLCRVNERMKLNGSDISDEDLILAAEQVKPAAKQMEDPPTEFEIITAMALCYFHRRRCDIVVLEVGLGGRLDATNVIPAPEVAVITNIGLEHTEVLGDTLEEISKEKAGIIKEGCVVVAYSGTPEVERVYERLCAQKHASLRKARFEKAVVQQRHLLGQSFDWMEFPALTLHLPGEHQLCNAVVVLETLRILQQRGWNIPDASVYKGLLETKWPARFEVLHQNPLFIADGAHNLQCIEMLAQNLETLLPDTRVVFLIGVLADKDYESMVLRLIPRAKAFICLTPDSPRALSAGTLTDYLRRRGEDATACGDVLQGIQTALSKAEGAPVVACGSLYLMGDIKQQFRPAFKKWQRKEKIYARGSLLPSGGCYHELHVRPR